MEEDNLIGKNTKSGATVDDGGDDEPPPVSRKKERLQLIKAFLQDILTADTPDGNERAIDDVASLMLGDPNWAELQDYGLRVLSTLSRKTPRNKKRIADGGALNALVRGMAATLSSARAQDNGCRALWSMAMAPRNRGKIAAAGGCGRLVDALEEHGTKTTTSSSSSVGGRREGEEGREGAKMNEEKEVANMIQWALGAMKALASDERARTELEGNGARAVVAAVMAARPAAAKIQSDGCAVLSNLVVDTVRQRVRPGSAAEFSAVVSAMVAHPDDMSVQRSACGALLHYTFLKSNASRLAEVVGREEVGDVLERAGEKFPLSCGDESRMVLDRLRLGRKVATAEADLANGAGGRREGEGAEFGGSLEKEEEAYRRAARMAPSHAGTGGAGAARDEAHRTFREVERSGPALAPIPFDVPTSYPRATRIRQVNVYYNKSESKRFVAKDVLCRTDDSGSGGETVSRCQYAYWKVPEKQTIKTKMGHLEICVVLRRCSKGEETGAIGDDDDVCFELTQRHVAVKVNYWDRMRRFFHPNEENPLYEIAAQEILGNDHPHALGVTEVLDDGNNLNAVMPYCGGGDLFDIVDEYIVKHPGAFGLPEDAARDWFRQLLRGMLHLQQRGICHRDLSPENVIVTDKRCLVIDLGMSLRVPFHSRDGSAVEATDVAHGSARRLITPQGLCGKRKYMSPEIWISRDDFDGFSVDVWTAGMILFFMLTGQSYMEPFDQIFRCVASDLPGLLNHWQMPLSSNAVDLLRGMLVVDPRNRLTLGQIMSHPWVTG